MVENNVQGRKVRKYFIEVEKQFRANHKTSLPSNYADALELLAKEVREKEKKQLQLDINKPKVDFAVRVTKSVDTVDIATAAKLLKFKGIGRAKLFKFLRDNNMLQKNNTPYQYQIKVGNFTVIETDYTINGQVKIQVTVRVTQKGLIKIAGMISNNIINNAMHELF
jgi:anti-repressor protein